MDGEGGGRRRGGGGGRREGERRGKEGAREGAREREIDGVSERILVKILANFTLLKALPRCNKGRYHAPAVHDDGGAGGGHSPDAPPELQQASGVARNIVVWPGGEEEVHHDARLRLSFRNLKQKRTHTHKLTKRKYVTCDESHLAAHVSTTYSKQDPIKARGFRLVNKRGRSKLVFLYTLQGRLVKIYGSRIISQGERGL